MNKLLLSLACILMFGSSVLTQTWGCPERDFKCQLDGRMKELRDNPKDPENYYNLGLVYQRNGSHKETIESFGMYMMIPGVKAADLAA